MFEFLFNFHKWIDTIKYELRTYPWWCGDVLASISAGTYIFYVVKCTPQPNHDRLQVRLSLLWSCGGFFLFFFFFLWVFWMFNSVWSNSVRHMQRVLYDDVSRSGSCDKVKEAKIILCIHSYIGAGGDSAPIGRKKSRSCCCCPTGQSSTYTIALGARCHFLCHQNFSHAKRTLLDTYAILALRSLN